MGPKISLHFLFQDITVFVGVFLYDVNSKLLS